jgi:general secretion pathway protein I
VFKNIILVIAIELIRDRKRKNSLLTKKIFMFNVRFCIIIPDKYVQKSTHSMSSSILQERKAQSRRSDSASGFTLLEVMVALAVMAIVLVSVYRMHSQSLTMNTAAQFYTQAPLLAQSKMAGLETLSEGGFSEDSGDFGEQFPGYSWKVSEKDVASEILGTAAEDLKQIDVTVSYNDDQFSYSLRTYRFKRE